MIKGRMSYLLISFLSMIYITGCGYAYYQTIKQPSIKSDPIRSNKIFYVKPIDLSKINYKDLGYEKKSVWKKETANLPKDYIKCFPDLLKREGIAKKKVYMLKRKARAKKGILVRVIVEKIILNWNAWSNKPDQFFCKIVFTKASNGKKLFSGDFEVNNRSGNFLAQSYGMTMSARMYNAANNIAWVVTKIMANGIADPDKY